MVNFFQKLDQVQEGIGPLIIGVTLGRSVVAGVGLTRGTHAPHLSRVLVQTLSGETVDALWAGLSIEVVLIYLIGHRVDII